MGGVGGVGGVGGWGRSLTPHTPHTPHTPLSPHTPHTQKASLYQGFAINLVPFGLGTKFKPNAIHHEHRQVVL